MKNFHIFYAKQEQKAYIFINPYYTNVYIFGKLLKCNKFV